MKYLTLQSTFALLSLTVAAAQTNYFGTTYTGDGTYYGDQSGAGHCSFQFSNSYTLPWTTGVYTGVAVNAPQYANSQPCGMCVAFWGTGPGSGANPISPTVQYAIATDECPECLSGSLDLAQDGDGRWSIDWYPVQCNVGDSAFQYSFQGSLATYVKMAITNTRVPVSAVSIATPDGTMEAMSRSVDNYWIADSGTYTFPAAVSITSIFGDTVTDTVNVASPVGAVLGKAQFPLNAAYETVGGASSTTPTAEATPAPTPEPTTAATAEPTAVPTPEPTAVPTPEPTAVPTPEPATATPEPVTATPEPTAEATTEPTAPAVALSPPPPYLSATTNHTVNTSAPAPPVPASAEVTPVPIVVPASTATVSAVVSNPTTFVTPVSTAAAIAPASPGAVTAARNPDGDNSLVSTPANCTLSVAALQQCGGRGGVCANQATNGTQCADAQWGNACCTSGFYCQRQQQWSWTCQRSEVAGADTTVSSGGIVADYKQCGGLGNCAESLCADAQWENYSCYDGFTCLRWDAFYYQCRDIPFAELAA